MKARLQLLHHSHTMITKRRMQTFTAHTSLSENRKGRREGGYTAITSFSRFQLCDEVSVGGLALVSSFCVSVPENQDVGFFHVSSTAESHVAVQQGRKGKRSAGGKVQETKPPLNQLSLSTM